jgi:hypothetical protein
LYIICLGNVQNSQWLPLPHSVVSVFDLLIKSTVTRCLVLPVNSPNIGSVLENVGSQHDLQQELGRTLETLTSEAKSTADRHNSDHVAATHNIAADTGRRLEGLNAELANFNDVNQSNKRVTSQLNLGVEAAGREQQTAVAAIQDDAAKWTAEQTAKHDVAQAQIHASFAAASAALSDKESALKIALGSVSDAAAENGRQLEASVVTEIGEPTAEMCGRAEGEVGGLLAGVEEFVVVRLREDQPTGATPVRLERSYPRYLAATSPHARITERSVQPSVADPGCFIPDP